MTPYRPGTACMLAFLAVFTVAVGLRAYRLGDDCFDCDELYAVRIQGVGPKAVAAVMARDGFHTNHPPLMTVPFLIWNALLGTSEAAVRLLPVLAGVVAVVAVFAFGCVLGRPWAGVFGAAILAVNPLHITYSTEARQYSLLVALIAVAHVLFVLSLRKPTRGLVVAYYFVAAWAALTHYFAVPVLLGHAAFAAWLMRKPGPNRRSAARLFLAVGLAGLPYLAWLPVMAFQSRNKWDHLATLTPSTLVDSLADLLGLGGWGTSIGLALSLAAIVLVAVGVWATRRVTVPVSAVNTRFVPLWLGWAVLAFGVLGGLGYGVVFPSMIEPMARETLSGYGYDVATVAEEVRLLRQTGLLGAGCVALAGALLLGWRRLKLEGEQPSNGEVNGGALLGCFVVVPIIVVALGGLTGVPFHQTRNLLVMLPAVCIVIGFGLDSFSRRVPGAVLAVAVLAGMTVAAGQYHAIGRIVGRDGPRLGIDTIDWRGVKAWLRDHPRTYGAVVLVNRPATDPGLYYLAEFTPLRLSPTAIDEAPRPAVFVHLTGNAFSEQLREKSGATRGAVKVAEGNGWEVYEMR